MGLLQKINLLNNFNLSKEEMMKFLDLNECVNEIGNINDEHDRDNTTTPKPNGPPTHKETEHAKGRCNYK